jgi:hypothetical protein
MRTFEIGDVIAEHTFVVKRPEGSSESVHARLGRPVLDEHGPGDAWMCPYQLDGSGSSRVFGIFGVDSMQALLLATHTIPIELAALARAQGAVLLSHGEPDTTFMSGCRMALEYAGDCFRSGDRADAEGGASSDGGDD